jgi:hypothetical protein
MTINDLGGLSAQAVKQKKGMLSDELFPPSAAWMKHACGLCSPSQSLRECAID